MTTAEQAEVIVGHRRRPGRRDPGDRVGTGARAERRTFTTTSPELVVRRPYLRRDGGGPGPERGAPDRAVRSRGPLPARLLPSPHPSGRHHGPPGRAHPRRPLVLHPVGGQRGRRQGDLPHELLASTPRAGRRVPAGGRTGHPPSGGHRGLRGAVPLRHPRARATPSNDRDGTYLSTRRCWFRTREPLPDDPAVHACVLAYFSDMTGAAFRPLSLGSVGHPHRHQPRPRPVVPPTLAGRRLEPVRSPRAGERGRSVDHPGHHARRGRHAAPEHGAGTAHPRARRADGAARDAALAAAAEREREASNERRGPMGLLEGQRAVVTGGGSGIGRATCRRMAEEGAQGRGLRRRRRLGRGHGQGDRRLLLRRRRGGCRGDAGGGRRGGGRAGWPVDHLQQRRHRPPSTSCTSSTRPSGTASCGST